MKSLLLIRHAKSSWDDFNISDFERPLTEKGNKDAIQMVERLIQKEVVIDGFISSSAKRAQKTAQCFATAYNVNHQNIILKDQLYQCPPHRFYDIVTATPDQLEHIAIFSHNPGITEFANLLTSVKIDHIPTCGIFAIKCASPSWKSFASSLKEFWFFESPKLYQ